ncbi:MAG: hypothetical protein EXR60_04335 [Dehalococcoidia bacterium]|nr:hypothetical protein [Dehalococcoidia bacterium]
MTTTGARPKQYYFEDLEVGKELPVSLKKKPTPRQLVQWAGASGDFYEIHYDLPFAQSTALQNIIVHGALKFAWLGQLMSDLAGPDGLVKKVGCSYRGMDEPDNLISGARHVPSEVTIKGTVKRKWKEQGENLVECDMWLENAKGEKTTPGTGLVALPARGR